VVIGCGLRGASRFGHGPLSKRRCKLTQDPCSGQGSIQPAAESHALRRASISCCSRWATERPVDHTADAGELGAQTRLDRRATLVRSTRLSRSSGASRRSADLQTGLVAILQHEAAVEFEQQADYIPICLRREPACVASRSNCSRTPEIRVTVEDDGGDWCQRRPAVGQRNATSI